MVTQATNMSLTSKREYLAKILGRSQRAGRAHKTRILDEFCLNCAYHRKAALRLLGRPERGALKKKTGPKPTYDPERFGPLLKVFWLASDQLCSKRLAAALPQWLPHYEALHRPLTPSLRQKLLAISPAQIDRLLRPARVRHPRRGLATTKPGSLLRHRIPTRGGPPNTSTPGHVEDEVTFTRSRAYRKNDNAHCEQKNYTFVRQLFGHQRLEHPELVALMNDLYGQEWSQYQNHFRPTFKLLSRDKRGSKTVRRYAPLATPYQRLRTSRAIAPAVKVRLRAEHARLNPFLLQKAIEEKLRKFFTLLGNLDRESTKP